VALVEPVSGAGMKFGEDDVKSEKTLWRLYQRWQAHFNVTRRDVSITPAKSIFNGLAFSVSQIIHFVNSQNNIGWKKELISKSLA